VIEAGYRVLSLPLASEKTQAEGDYNERKLRTQGKNRQKPWKNAGFFEGVWKSPLKTRVWRVQGG
jgi:hypothetical protein